MEEEKILKIIFEAREEDLARLDEEDEMQERKQIIILREMMNQKKISTYLTSMI